MSLHHQSGSLDCAAPYGGGSARDDEGGSPVGMNVFVIKSVVQDVTFSSIFKGVLPFIATDILRLVILIAFPIIALWLPNQM